MIENLPARPGPPPRVSDQTPQQQLSQNAPYHLQQELYQRCLTLTGVRPHPSHVSVPGARALSRAAPHTSRPEAFMGGAEFVHIHPSYDGSLHACLPFPAALAVLAAGWGQFHPYAGQVVPVGTMLIYGPRDSGELETCWSIVLASYQHTGAES